MPRKSRKQAIKWVKRLLTYGVFFYLCYCVAEFYIRKEQSAESAAIHQTNEKACQSKLASMKQVPILGGAYIDKTLVPEFYVGMPEMVNKKACLAIALKGLFWWTGTGLHRHQNQRL
ncbi:hypothetical protein F8N49_23630, partial [Pseudomonas sp. GXM4]